MPHTTVALSAALSTYLLTYAKRDRGCPVCFTPWMLAYIYSKCNARCQPAKITALRGLSSCARLTLFQSRAKACSDRATPSYRRYDTFAKSPALWGHLLVI